ncbi:putative soyasaponin III rhamnosyltransferase [Rosa chinensis]|uniref:Glycosyltransferase n=1 Tax=Rosa chinensis TaxID=74649 RepID=A0A2P6RPX8_ROSCH|nr:putative UDP-rhamnose:rhamnosyltransferase 1 [Rosa chinensis]PRQ48441.1 putative soyasaponin III rhamnosyltransferase [Rosa chinensis]
MDSTTEPKKLHIAFFPWLAFGHIIPFLEIAKHVARRGHKDSFISTPRNIQRLPKIPEKLTPLINLVQIPLPNVKNLPENAEATTDIPSHMIPYLKIAPDGLEVGISEFLRSQIPDWIIYDFASYWLPPIAIELGISLALFNTCNASTLCFLGPTSPDLISRYSLRTQPQQLTVPPDWIPFSSKVAYRPFEAKRLFNIAAKPKASAVEAGGVTEMFPIQAAVEGCQIYFVRTCKEMEAEWLDLLQHLHQKTLVIPVGLLPPELQQRDEDQEDGSSWSRIAEWLDKQEKETIVYVTLGSEANLSQEEFNELALGLELSGLPFFWALTKLPLCEDGESLKLPDWFVDRTNGHGIFWISWAPQLKILSHESIGGFLTHCGWSSVIEGLHYGRPLIMFPVLYDQGLNARFWDKKFGIEVPRDEETGSFTRNTVAESLSLVVREGEGKAYRDGAREYSKLFRDKDLHARYMDKCVEYLEID